MELVATDHQHPLFRLQQDLPQIKGKDVIYPIHGTCPSVGHGHFMHTTCRV